MIALVLGILLIGAVISVFIGTSQTYRTQEAMSKVQETGRFATEILARDIRQTGLRGACMPGAEINSLLDSSDSEYDDQIHDFGTGALMGWHQEPPGEYSDDMINYVGGTDVLLLKKASSMDVSPSGNTPANAATVNLDGPSGVAREQLVVISDAEACDVFQNTANSNANTITRGAAAMDPGNLNPGLNDLSKQFDENAELFRFESRLYYVGRSDSTGQKALRRLDFGLGTARDEELVTGVEDFRVRYGVDTSDDRRVNQFVTADNVSDWEDVRAIRIILIAKSADTENVVDAPQELAVDGGTWTADDRRLYQVFTSTTGLRNRLD
ncbi:PilW family protein [Thioalkalivibrio sp. ALJ24]|uniref:PilW family protein n=1 Tax=Thioalkalivibrio sp. ALJ24 TaxID=545276 RepID=UPI001E2DDC82|nr:PilW family protein [Thioalkalivibrio sp. ALJ24]